MPQQQDKTAIRDAATMIVIRDRTTAPRILMGQRGAKAAFMPSKFVFPGGAVDADDADTALARPLTELCQSRLTEASPGVSPHALAVAAIRELWEETGLILGRNEPWQQPPPDWQGFAEQGYMPDAWPMQFIFRAITPPGRPRRFDARFFLLDADALANDLDDFSGASDELSHVQWVPLARARSLDMPFITEVVLAEVEARAADPSPPATVPFFKNDDEESLFLRLKGVRPTS
ncbi:MAG: NUDIX hydrolase [Roseobacter sp.]|jgi:8-oxo-dGTP pyrophosphatase MutT (NUDIX family)|nr:NUDIX hydrolase [Roseobacter sp.]